MTKLCCSNKRPLDIAKNCAHGLCQVSLYVFHYIIPKRSPQAPVRIPNGNCFLSCPCHAPSGSRILLALFHMLVLASGPDLEKILTSPGSQSEGAEKGYCFSLSAQQPFVPLTV